MTRARDVATQGGLVLINSTTVTNASTVNFTNVFSSTYQNYKVIINPTAASTNLSFYLNLLNGTTSATTGYYFAYNGLQEDGGSANAYGQNLSYYFAGATSTNAYYASTNLDIFNPNLTTFTNFQAQMNSQTSVLFSRSGGGWHTVAASYDGFRIYTSTGNFSGVVETYGYK